ncbi:hypothetical protein MH1LPH_17340 [Lactiplantibacillus brownii]
MKQLSRETLINVLASTYPDHPRVFFEVMTDDELHTTFQAVASEHSTIIRQYRSIEYVH